MGGGGGGGGGGRRGGTKKKKKKKKKNGDAITVNKASVFTDQVFQIRVTANSAIYNQKTLTNTKINERMAKVILTYVLRPSVLLDIVHFHEFSCTNIIQYII